MTEAEGIVVAIDASRNRSGGARVHLAGLLGGVDPREHGVRSVHLWSYPALLAAVPEAPWLVKHSPAALARGLPRQLWWQRRHFPAAIARAGCDVLLTTDAGSVCRHRPSVVMSRDMLSFEDGEMRRYGFSTSRLRLELLKHVQVGALRSASGALFLTRYAADVIQRYTGPLPVVRIIPHAVADEFRRRGPPRAWPADGLPIRCVYVSNADLYKHQWHVVSAMSLLRQKGYDVRLTLIGGGGGPAGKRLDGTIARLDPDGAFVERRAAVVHSALPAMLNESDLFIFASSCENMPNTLLEGMAAGLPIACSRRGPMPEVLQDGGTYFEPEDPASIADAIEALLRDATLRDRVTAAANARAATFTWRRTASETWSYLGAVSRASMATPG